MGKKRRKILHRTSANRARMWDKKMSPTAYAAYLEATKPMALEKIQYYQAVHEHLISLVKDVVCTKGQEPHLIHEYMWFACEIWQATQRYRSRALQIEADATFLKYLYRGRDETTLREIAKRLGIQISDWEVLLGRLVVSEQAVYRGTKRALAETLERVETDLTDAEFVYDAEGNLVEIIKTDKVTGRRKRIKLEYDAQGNLIKKTEEWIS